jgi:hypothetical protein
MHPCRYGGFWRRRHPVILSVLQPLPHISRHEASSNGFLARPALPLSTKLSLGCGGAVVPAVDSSMILQTTHACRSWRGLARALYKSG